MLWPLVNEIFRIMFSNKVLGIKETVGIQGHFYLLGAFKPGNTQY